MTEGISGTIKDTQGLKNVNADTVPLFGLYTENLNVDTYTTRVKTRSIAGTILIWGNSGFGQWGTYTWGTAANVSFILGNTLAGILGTATLGSNASTWSILRVINPNNIWKESLRTDSFEDTTNTTATWDTTNFRWTFTTGQIIQTLAFYLDQTTITNATLTIDSSRITTPANLSYELSADGGTNWETVTLGTKHTFTDTGIDLRLKVTASGAATIDVDDSDDVSIPIEVSYNQ
jgi:hypothetical protein